MKIVAISGLDGSGKSTQINLLKNYLEAQGKRVFYFHAVKFGIAEIIASFIKKLFDTILRSEHIVKSKSVTKSGRLGIWFRKIALRIDITRFKKLIRKLEKQDFDYILSDHYFYDSTVNIEYLENMHLCKCHYRPLRHSFSEASESGNPENFSWIPHQVRNDNIIKPTLAIYLKTDPEIIMRRERVPDQGIEYLKKKRELYNKVADEWDLKIIDGDQKKEIIFEEIKSNPVFSSLARKCPTWRDHFSRFARK